MIIIINIIIIFIASHIKKVTTTDMVLNDTLKVESHFAVESNFLI